MKELFNQLSNISAFFTEKRFVYDTPSDRATSTPGGAEAAPAQQAAPAPAPAIPPAAEAATAVRAASASVDRLAAAQPAAASAQPASAPGGEASSGTIGLIGKDELMDPYSEDNKQKDAQKPAAEQTPAPAEVKTEVADTNEYRKSMLKGSSQYFIFKNDGRDGEYKVDFKENKKDAKTIGLGDLLSPDAKVVYVHDRNTKEKYSALRDGKYYINPSTGKRVFIFGGDSVNIPQSKEDMDGRFAAANKINSQRLTSKVNKIIADWEAYGEDYKMSNAAKEALRLSYLNKEAGKKITAIGNALKYTEEKWYNPDSWTQIAEILFKDAKAEKPEVKDDKQFKADFDAAVKAEAEKEAVAAIPQPAQPTEAPVSKQEKDLRDYLSYYIELTAEQQSNMAKSILNTYPKFDATSKEGQKYLAESVPQIVKANYKAREAQLKKEGATDTEIKYFNYLADNWRAKKYFENETKLTFSLRTSLAELKAIQAIASRYRTEQLIAIRDKGILHLGEDEALRLGHIVKAKSKTNSYECVQGRKWVKFKPSKGEEQNYATIRI